MDDTSGARKAALPEHMSLSPVFSRVEMILTYWYQHGRENV